MRCKCTTSPRESDDPLSGTQIHNIRRALDDFSGSFNARTFRLIEADYRSDVRFGTERTLIRPVLLLALAG